MELDITEQTRRFREHVRTVLASDPVQRELAALNDSGGACEPDPRQLYRLLGAANLLAVNWPAEYGGGGRNALDLAVVNEELIRHGVPDTLHINTIQIVGSVLLLAGSETHKRRLLPAMARGELFASVLFTEPDAGSDLAALCTTAAALPDGGYLLNGCKRYSLKSHLVDYGLSLARTGHHASKYQGLTLFLVPLGLPGVRLCPLPSIANEAFHDVEFSDVRVDHACLIGAVGEGWSLLTKSLAVERTGLDYYVRADYLLEAATKRAWMTGLADDGNFLVVLGRLRGRVETSRCLALQALRRVEAGEADERLSAIAKWYCSETAQQVAWWSTETLGLEACVSRTSEQAIVGGLLEAAYREAPGMTISAGASEVLLDSIAGTFG